MTEEEAAAAVLALGSVLEWELAGVTGVEYAPTPEGHYQVGKKKGRGPLFRYARFIDWQASPFEEGFADESPHIYTGRVAAIAACERHHATGKWEH